MMGEPNGATHKPNTATTSAVTEGDKFPVATCLSKAARSWTIGPMADAVPLAASEWTGDAAVLDIGLHGR